MSNEDESAPVPDEPEHLAILLPTDRSNNTALLAQIIARRVYAARIAADMTQEELSGGDFSKSSISAIERAAITPSLPTIALLAKRLGVPASYLLGESEIDSVALKQSKAAPRLTAVQTHQRQNGEINLMLDQAEAFLRQDQPLEALEKLGGSEKPPEDLSFLQRIHWYRLGGWALGLAGRSREAVPLLQEGLRLAEFLRVQVPGTQKKHLAELVANFQGFLGNAFCALGQIKLAYEYHHRGLNAIRTSVVMAPEVKLLIYKGLGHDALALGRYSEAISFYKDALEVAYDLNNLRQQGAAYWGLGLAYQRSGDLFRAKKSCQQALEALGVHSNLHLIAQIRNRLGHVLTELQEYEEAEHQLSLSLEGARRLGDSFTQGNVLGNVAHLYIAQGKFDKAITTAQEGMQLAQENRDDRNKGQLCLTLASAYDAKQERVSAEQAFQEAIRIFEQISDNDMLMLAYERYTHFLAAQERFREAYELLRLVQPQQ